MSFDPHKNRPPNLKLVPPSSAPTKGLDSGMGCQMLLSSSMADFMEGDMGQAMEGVRALSAYTASWPDEAPDMKARLHACELAFKSWQSDSDLETLGNLFWAARQLTDSDDNTELLHFVFDAVAHNLLQRQMFSDMREQLTWARTWNKVPENRIFLLAYELTLAVQQSGAAGASEKLVSQLSAAMRAPYSFEQFKSWFPIYLSAIAMGNYSLDAGNLHLARQHSSFARNLALAANAPIFEIRALELEAVISCEAKEPMAMHDARTDIYKISTTFDFVSAMEQQAAGNRMATQEKAAKISELPSTVMLDSGYLKTSDTCHVLTKRERGVLKRVQYGDRNKEIARTLNITEDTVKYHLKNIFTKLGVSKRIQAVKIAQEKGYISLFC